jgi:hypothetical protein
LNPCDEATPALKAARRRYVRKLLLCRHGWFKKYNKKHFFVNFQPSRLVHKAA